MIRAESMKDYRVKSDAVQIRCNVKIGVPDNLLPIAEEVFIAELVAIFKQLDKINPEILLDALEIYREGLK